MAEGALLGKGYIEYTLKQNGDQLAQVTNQFKEIEKNGKQALEGLHTNFEQTFKNMSTASQQATVKWRKDIDDYAKSLEKIKQLEKQYADELKDRPRGMKASWEAHLNEQVAAIHKLREEAKALYAGLGEDQKKFYQSFAQQAGPAAQNAFQGFRTAFSNALSGTDKDAHSWGALIGHNLMVPIQRAGDGVAAMFRGVFEKVASMAKYAMLGVAGGITAAFGTALFKGMDQLGKIDEVSTKMKFLGRNAAEVNATMRDMEWLTNNTGASFDELVDKANAFMAAGIKPGSDIKQMMQDVTDVAAATGQSISSVSDTLMRMISGNTERMQYQLQTWQAGGFPIFSILEEQYKTDAKGVAKMIKNHEIGWKEIQHIIETRLHGISEAMDDTFNGKLRKIWRNIGNIGEAILQPFFGGMSAGLSGINHWIEDFVQKLRQNQPKIVHTVGQIVDAFFRFGSGLMELFRTITDAIAATVGAAAQIAEDLGQHDLAQKLGKAANMIANTVGGAFDTAKVAIDGVRESTQGWFDSLENATTLTSAFGDAVSSMTDKGLLVDLKGMKPEDVEAMRTRLRMLGADFGEQVGDSMVIVPKTPDMAKIINDMRRQAGLAPVEIPVKLNWATGQPVVPPFSWDLKDRNLVPGAQLHPQADYTPQPSNGWLRKTIQGIPIIGSYINMATNSAGSLPNEATIQNPVGSQGLVQWAEPSTHGEAFIPLAPSNRGRSLDIWAETGHLLGVYDTGGMFPRGIEIGGKYLYDDPYFTHGFGEKDPSNLMRFGEAATPWWGFTVPHARGGIHRFAGGGWFGGAGGSGGNGRNPGWFSQSGGYSGVGGLRLWAGQLQRLIYKMFPAIKEIGGYRAHDPYPDHPSGEAIDVMIPGWNTKAGVALGNRIKDFTMQNAKPLHVDYDIWRQAMWYPGRGRQGMASRGSPTQNHFDHVHIRVKRGGGGPDTGRGFPAGLGATAMYGPSWGDGYYAMNPLAAMMGPVRPAWLPGSQRMLKGMSFDVGGFRWPWKLDAGNNQIGPFPVPPVVGQHSNAGSPLGRSGGATIPSSGTRWGGTGNSGFVSGHPAYVPPTFGGGGMSDSPNPDLSAGIPSFSIDDGGDSSSDSSSDSSTDSPYYPGTFITPDEAGYFNTSDFLNDPRITPAEAKKLRNAADKIENLNNRLDVANQQLAELKANPKTKPSTISAKMAEIARLQHDRDNAVADLNQLQSEVVANKDKGGKGGTNAALEGNPYYKLMQADKLRQEAYAAIMPDAGALADIGIGGLKESLLPPGFSDPTQWGVTQAASGLFNFLGGIMPDPYSAGAFNILGAALGGSGSGVATAVKGMIPQPWGTLEIGSPEDAPGSDFSPYTGEGGQALPLGAIPMPKAGQANQRAKKPGARGDSAVGSTINDFSTHITGGNDGLTNKVRDNIGIKNAQDFRRIHGRR